MMQVRVFCVRFSPTGQSFSVATTQGLMQYSLNSGGVFQPFELDLNATPQSVRDALAKKEWSSALMSALKLNESNIIKEAIEKIPFTDSNILFFVVYQILIYLIMYKYIIFLFQSI